MDPLSWKFVHNSPYAFSENRLIDAFELEGLQLVRYYWKYDSKSQKMTAITGSNGKQIYDLIQDGSLKQHYSTGVFVDGKYEEIPGDVLNATFVLNNRGKKTQNLQFDKGPSAKQVATFTYNATVGNVGHELLDFIGLLPIAGEVADGINALWYAAEGDKTNAALSAASLIPFLGWASTGTKYVLKTASYAGEIIYKGSGELFEAVFKLSDGRSVGILAETVVDGKKINLNEIVFYGNKADGAAMEGSDLGMKEMLELRTSVNAWAKENGFEFIEYNGKRAENSSSVNPGMNLHWGIKLE